jgi:myo-inositol 2-dehydrogenase/D-chiro-inositol 1-dehydrogenase
MTPRSDQAHASETAEGGRVPLVVVGAGVMGRAWADMLASSPHARLVGVVDLDELAAETVARSAGSDIVWGTSVTDVAERSGAAAVVDVTVPQAHRSVNEKALRAGLPVLCEKPLAPTVAEALRQVALADATGGLLMVSQSRRWFAHLAAFRAAVRQLGPLASVQAQFFHEDHEPGFREQMAHPLLVDMSVHHFDQLRWLAGDEPVAVRCSSWSPPWSWFAGDASATADFELASGAHFAYAGSRCARGLSTSWNADWRAWGEHGAASWDGDHEVQVDAPGVEVVVPDQLEGIAASVEDFVRCLRTGATPYDEVRANVRSIAMVEGAVLSSERGGTRVVLAELLRESLVTAIADERSEDVLAVLRSWDDVEEVLAGPAPVGS